MKVYVESKSFVDGKTKKEIFYDEFSVQLDFTGFKPHKLVLKPDDKTSKVLLADNIECADFGLVVTKSSNNEDYYKGVIHLPLGNKIYDFKVSLDKNQVMLLRLYFKENK